MPVTVTKAKVPFLNVDMYKGFLSGIQQQYNAFDKYVTVKRLPQGGDKSRLQYHYWDMKVSSRMSRDRGLFTVTYQDTDENTGSFVEITTS